MGNVRSEARSEVLRVGRQIKLCCFFSNKFAYDAFLRIMLFIWGEICCKNHGLNMATKKIILTPAPMQFCSLYIRCGTRYCVALFTAYLLSVFVILNITLLGSIADFIIGTPLCPLCIVHTGLLENMSLLTTVEGRIIK